MGGDMQDLERQLTDLLAKYRKQRLAEIQQLRDTYPQNAQLSLNNAIARVKRQWDEIEAPIHAELARLVSLKPLDPLFPLK